jgi:tetratricopeptide (TPR) repeat protein
MLLHTTVQAGTVMYEEANKLYHNKQYDEAANLYMQIINDGYCSCSVYYNAGNSYYKSKHLGMAVWCFQKALQYEPGNALIKENLQLTNSKLSASFKKTREWIGIKWIRNILEFHTLNKWCFGAWLFFTIAVLFLIFKKIKDLAPFTIALRKLSWLLFFGYTIGAVSNYLFQKMYKHGIVVNNAILYNNAQDKGLGSSQATEGIRVRIIKLEKGQGTQPSKYNIQMPNGTEAWINVSDVKML